jgi:hypothetical protein
MKEKHLRRPILRKAATILYNETRIETKQSIFYEQRFENRHPINLEEYKEMLLYDILVGKSEDDLKAIADAVYIARGCIPNHLLFHEFFRRYKDQHQPTRGKYNPFTIEGKTKFKNYTGVVPIASYRLWSNSTREAGGWNNSKDYACLSFVTWADRFIELYESKGTPIPKCGYTSSNEAILYSMGVDFMNIRISNRIKEKFPKWFKEGEKKGKVRDGIYQYHERSNAPSTIDWYGTLIYKPNFRDINELADMTTRLCRYAPSGYSTDAELLANANPLFEQFLYKLKSIGGGMFSFNIEARRYAQNDSPERFKQLANDLSELSNLANKLSEQFQSFKDEKLIGKRTSTVTLVGKLLADELSSNPIKYFNTMEFRPPRWFRQDSLIFWICKELIEGE